LKNEFKYIHIKAQFDVLRKWYLEVYETFKFVRPIYTLTLMHVYGQN